MAHEPYTEFRCEVRESEAAAVVEVHGELDLATGPEAEAALREQARSKRHVTLDLRGLQFMDSTGLRMIMELDRLAREDGFGFAVVRGTPAVQRVMNIAGIDEHLELVDAPAELQEP